MSQKTKKKVSKNELALMENPPIVEAPVKKEKKTSKGKKKEEAEVPITTVEETEIIPIVPVVFTEKEEQITLQPVFYSKVMHTKLYVAPRFLNSGFEKKIVEMLVSRYENKCCQEGFVQKDSIQLLDRENGCLYGSQFHGDICFFVKFSCMICNPVDGMILEGVVKDMNRLGILAENGPLSIVVARQFHANQAFFDTLHIGDRIYVEVVRSRFFLNDRKIEVIGRYVETGDLKKKLESKKPLVAWNLEKRKDHEEPLKSTVFTSEDQQELSEYSDGEMDDLVDDEEEPLEEEMDAQEDAENELAEEEDDMASMQEGGLKETTSRSGNNEQEIGLTNEGDDEESLSSYSGDEDDSEGEDGSDGDEYSDEGEYEYS